MSEIIFLDVEMALQKGSLGISGSNLYSIDKNKFTDNYEYEKK
jgi:hypothetical protein